MKPGILEKAGSTAVGEVVLCLLYTDGAHTATKYLDEETVIRATRPMLTPKRKRGKKLGHRKLNGEAGYDTRVNVVLTIGHGNYLDRQFVKACKRAGEPLPVKKIQIRRMPERRAT